MKVLSSVIFAALFVLIGCSQENPERLEPASTATVADVAYSSGKIYTVNEARPWAEAVFVHRITPCEFRINVEPDCPPRWLRPVC